MSHSFCFDHVTAVAVSGKSALGNHNNRRANIVVNFNCTFCYFNEHQFITKINHWNAILLAPSLPKIKKKHALKKQKQFFMLVHVYIYVDSFLLFEVKKTLYKIG